MKPLLIILMLLITGCLAQGGGDADSQGGLEITPITHASLMINYGGLVVYVDPTDYLGTADYSGMFRADIILITHHHFDHFNPKTINQLLKEDTVIIGPETLLETITYARAMRNGDVIEMSGVRIEAVPAYNLKKRAGGEYHPRGRDNGYVINFGSTRVYVAGDTECVPEVRNLKGIDVAFVPIDGVYTMSPEEAAACVKTLSPRVVYPYHQGSSDPAYFASLLNGTGIEVMVLELP
jgi:L-ascorbate metabolism protein UlaG (beta-lactamase superfamily)